MAQDHRNKYMQCTDDRHKLHPILEEQRRLENRRREIEWYVTSLDVDCQSATPCGLKEKVNELEDEVKQLKRNINKLEEKDREREKQLLVLQTKVETMLSMRVPAVTIDGGCRHSIVVGQNAYQSPAAWKQVPPELTSMAVVENDEAHVDSGLPSAIAETDSSFSEGDDLASRPKTEDQ